MICKAKTISPVGIETVPIEVECETKPGSGVKVNGLTDAAEKDSLLRTITALKANNLKVPGEKTIIDLVPSDIKKTGTQYDLVIALTLIQASKKLALPILDKTVTIGELGLDGQVRSVPGAVHAVEYAENNNLDAIIPADNYNEIEGLYDTAKVHPVKNIQEAIIAASGGRVNIDRDEIIVHEPSITGMWDKLPGNLPAKRALEIAAAGKHNILLVGPLGSSKASIAKAMMDILPPMSLNEIRETAKIYSSSMNQRFEGRPFRSPHYSCSIRAILGGGVGDSIKPGEVSLAHNGVLYMGEFPKWPKSIMEALRTPIEDGKVTISRLKGKIEYPANFQFIAACEPCPCGYYGHGDRCTCTTNQRNAYLSRLSSPIMDRIDIQAWTQPMPDKPEGGARASVTAQDVAIARAFQMQRQGKLNSELTASELDIYCPLDEESKELMETLFDRLGLSARAYTKIVKIARTIADLDGKKNIEKAHVAEACGYRFLDKKDNGFIK